MRHLTRRLLGIVFVRYFASSGIALGVDLGCLVALVWLGASAGPAAAVAYSIGIVAHWFVVSRAVFGEAVAAPGSARTRQKALFVLSALLGLGLTTGIVSIGAALGFHVAATKIAAVGASFVSNWLVRRRLVFRAVDLAAA